MEQPQHSTRMSPRSVAGAASDPVLHRLDVMERELLRSLARLEPPEGRRAAWWLRLSVWMRSR